MYTSKTVTPLQPVVTEGERIALEIAHMLAAGEEDKAKESLETFAEMKHLAHWEVVAITEIASCMFHGLKWKKDSE